MAPLLATPVLVAIGMASLMWWGPAAVHSHGWQTPQDLWRTFEAASRLAHLQVSGIYAPPTSLVSFPGAAVVLVPAALVVGWLGLVPCPPLTTVADGSAWWVVGPYEMLLSCTALFAADALARRMGLEGWRRLALAAASAVALWSVAVRWGHPEDCLAVACTLWSANALSEGQRKRAAWIFGAGVAVQPLVLLAVPVLVATLAVRDLAPCALRAAAPAATLLAVAYAANGSATTRAVIDQPNWPRIDHPTPWVAFAPRLGDHTVAAGPGRVVAVLASLALGLVVHRRVQAWRTRLPGSDPEGPWPADLVAEVLWWIALALALRCAFESVMVAYYAWAPLAVALAAAAPWWTRLVPCAIAATLVTFLSQLQWRSEWGWWAMVLVLLGATLGCAWRWNAPPPLAGLGARSELGLSR